MDALCLGLGMKFCSKCNTKKNETDFHKCKNSKDGLTYYCKECNSKSARDWAKNNPEKNRAKTKKYYQKHPEYWKENWKKQYEKDPEINRQRCRNWKKNNPE